MRSPAQAAGACRHGQARQSRRQGKGYQVTDARTQLLPNRQGLIARRRHHATHQKIDALSRRTPGRLSRIVAAHLGNTIDRRTFLQALRASRSARAAVSQLPFSMMGKARGRREGPAAGIEVKRTVCTHCSVGCAIDAVVQNGVWIRQEPVFDSPINLGAHCAKGASIREHGMTATRTA